LHIQEIKMTYVDYGPAYLLKCEGFANNADCPFEGQFLQWFDPNAPLTGQIGGWTRDMSKAKVFVTTSEALEYWRQPRTIDNQIRPDGKPNRPLTAFSVSIVPLGKGVRK
jgi:hypothetical protein